jgi:hypothetical protein
MEVIINMHKILLGFFVFAAIAAIFPIYDSSAKKNAPSDTSYNLTLIGVSKNKTAEISYDKGNRIFVPLWDYSRIMLTGGNYKVLDADATDGIARFQLPISITDEYGITSYTVYVRTLGKPTGKTKLASCYSDEEGEWCPLDFLSGFEPIRLSSGERSYENITDDLLSVEYCLAWEEDNCISEIGSTDLFDEDTMRYLWEYDNGLKKAELRFHEISSTIPW